MLLSQWNSFIGSLCAGGFRADWEARIVAKSNRKIGNIRHYQNYCLQTFWFNVYCTVYICYVFILDLSRSNFENGMDALKTFSLNKMWTVPYLPYSVYSLLSFAKQIFCFHNMDGMYFCWIPNLSRGPITVSSLYWLDFGVTPTQ